MRLPTDAPPAIPSLGRVLDFLRLIWALDHALHRASKRMERTLGITGPQRLVIRIVGRFPGIPAGHLAGILHLHPSTLTGILKRLERRGLVHRRRDPRDGRRVLLGLTVQGRKLDVATPGTIEAAVERVLSGLARGKVQASREVLSALSKALETRTGDT